MSSTYWSVANAIAPRPTSVRDLLTTLRLRRAFENEERAQQRLAQLAEQRSDSNPPDVRIRAWEKLHGLRLPFDPQHPVLDVIAVATRLTLPEVQAEQHARSRQRALRATQLKEPLEGSRAADGAPLLQQLESRAPLYVLS